MAIAYPTALDSLTNPTSTNAVTSPSHAQQHSDANDAIEALEVKVGITNSADSSSLDYKLSGVTAGDKAVSKTGTETLTNKTLTTPTIGSFTNANHTHQDSSGGGQLNATSVFSTGTVPTARLGSGSASSATFLRGDQTWQAIAAASSPVVNVYTASATWTKPVNLVYVVVEVQAAGGGSGSSGAAAGNSSGGGGAGGYSKRLIPAASLGATETVTVGSGGGAGSSGNGSTGGNSSFGTLATATGGVHSTRGGSGGAGGTAANGDINISGQTGGNFKTAASNSQGGDGGDSQLGKGGRGSVGASGVGGVSYGGGGGGSGQGGSENDGSAGANGVVIVTEYYI